MILTEEFLKTQNACAEGIQSAFENNFVGQEYSDAIRGFITMDQKDFAGWLIEQKSTETYVRANGKVITMGTTYQVFNPLTGLHSQYASEAEAKEALARLCEILIDRYKPTVCQEITNENGDSAWTAIDLVATRKVTIE
jgi:hypothetical protein